jgi:hypothetical protein
MHKRPLSCPQLRTVPRQFSWVAQRLVRERSIDQRSPPACALYLLLVTGADAQGLSYYAEPSRGQRWSLPGAALHQRRGPEGGGRPTQKPGLPWRCGVRTCRHGRGGTASRGGEKPPGEGTGASAVRPHGARRGRRQGFEGRWEAMMALWSMPLCP